MTTEAPQSTSRHAERSLFDWHPAARSADSGILPQLLKNVGRAQELVSDSGLLSGSLQLARDLIIGPGLRLSAKPDWRALGQSPDWASEWASEVEAQFPLWALDVDCRSDVSGRCNFNQRLRQICYTFLLKGQALAIAEWRPNRPGFYGTCIRAIDPDRLSTPPQHAQRRQIRRGIRTNRDGMPITYYIRNSHPSDRRQNLRDSEYRPVPAYTNWGRRRVLHVYDPELAEQSQGKSPLTSILARYKKLDLWEDLTLESAAVNAMFAAVMESELESISEAVGGFDMTDLAEQLAKWYSGQALRFDGIKIPHLFPGEKLALNRPEQPTAAFADFENAFHRHFASALGMSYEQFARDYSETNYSGALAGRQDSWRTFLARRELIQSTYATQEYALWLEEAFNRRDIPIPSGSPSFYDAKTAWTGCTWIGPGRGELNSLQETNAKLLKLQHGVTTLEDWCAEQGEDWSSVLEQRARELQHIQVLESEYGVDLSAAVTLPEISNSDSESN